MQRAKNKSEVENILGLILVLSPIFLIVWFERDRNTVVVQSNEADKSDIGYWFSLFEKDATTHEEYEVKKAKLINR